METVSLEYKIFSISIIKFFCILVGEGEVRKLWRHIQPYFHSLMSRVFLRELSSTQFETASSVQSASSSSTPAPVGVASSLELPYYSKYLLLAAYIASYNPAKTDKRFFSKVSPSLCVAPPGQVTVSEP